MPKIAACVAECRRQLVCLPAGMVKRRIGALMPDMLTPRTTAADQPPPDDASPARAMAAEQQRSETQSSDACG